MKKFLLRRIGVADDHAGKGPSLQDCIEVVLSQADTLMVDVLEGLAVSAAKNKGKSVYGELTPVTQAATDFLCGQASAVKKTFASQLRTAAYRTAASELAEPPLVRFEDLQLLDSRQIDINIEFALAQQEVLRSVDDVVPAVSALVSSLLGWTTVQPQLNPLKPEAFVRALQATLLKHAPDEQARTALILPAAGLLGVGLRQLYREISDWLRSQGVEPASPEGALLGGAGVLGGLGGQASDTAVNRTLVTLDKLRKLLSGELDGSAGMPNFLHTVPASFVALEDMKLVEPLMKRLAQRASQRADSAIKPMLPTALSPDAQAQGKQLGRQLSAEVLCMMLDNLMQDDRLLPPVRQLIKSLEPVLLTLAKADPRFFSERQHPARQFLDRLTHRSLAYASADDAGFPQFLTSISQAVADLAAGAAEATEFAHVLQQLDAGWAQAEVAQRQQHEDAARALLHAEQRNLLAQRLADDFQARVADPAIPEAIGTFLRGPWAQVVAESQLACAEGSADADGYQALVDDLLWSVQLPLARRNRTRLVQLVPGLLVGLNQGLQLIQYPADRIADFFDALISIHEQVFEGPRLPPETLTAPPDLADSGQTEAVSGFWVADDEALESGYLPEVLAQAGVAAPGPWSVGDLKTGVWVELLVAGAWLRAQLTWASPHRTLFMFISGGGLAHSMSRRTMERLRMQGAIRVVSSGPLVDHALDGVVRSALQNDSATQAPMA
jgi:hypothetical protein